MQLNVTILPGDLLWQIRPPTGVCLLLEVVGLPQDRRSMLGWVPQDYPVYRLLHQSGDIFEDPHYYYEKLNLSQRQENEDGDLY